MAKKQLRTCFKCELPTLGTDWTIIIRAENNITKKTGIIRTLCGPCFGIKKVNE